MKCVHVAGTQAQTNPKQMNVQMSDRREDEVTLLQHRARMEGHLSIYMQMASKSSRHSIPPPTSNYRTRYAAVKVGGRAEMASFAPRNTLLLTIKH